MEEFRECRLLGGAGKTMGVVAATAALRGGARQSATKPPALQNYFTPTHLGKAPTAGRQHLSTTYTRTLHLVASNGDKSAAGSRGRISPGATRRGGEGESVPAASPPRQPQPVTVGIIAFGHARLTRATPPIPRTKLTYLQGFFPLLFYKISKKKRNKFIITLLAFFAQFRYDG